MPLRIKCAKGANSCSTKRVQESKSHHAPSSGRASQMFNSGCLSEKTLLKLESLADEYYTNPKELLAVLAMYVTSATSTLATLPIKSYHGTTEHHQETGL